MQSLCCRELEGLSTEETAQVLDISTANVKTRLHRARLRLANCCPSISQSWPSNPGKSKMAEHAGNCEHLLADLSDYLDGEAAASTCAEIERHLGDCPDCRVVVDTLRKTISLYRELPQPDFSAEARTRLFTVLNLPPQPPT